MHPIRGRLDLYERHSRLGRADLVGVLLESRLWPGPVTLDSILAGINPLGDGKMSVIGYVEQKEVGIITIEQARLLDDLNLRNLQKEILELVVSIEVKNVVLDFRLVDFVASAGLDMLIRTRKRCIERGLSLCLCSTEQTVAEAIRITRLDQLFQIEPDVAHAIAWFQRGSDDLE